jgi:hypothetical protein
MSGRRPSAPRVHLLAGLNSAGKRPLPGCQVLRGGLDVVLDWNQWSRERRREWASKATAQGYEPVLHYIRVPLDTAIFEEPAEDEGLLLRIIGD